MTHGLGGQIALELGPYGPGAAMGPRHLAPDGAHLGLLALGLAGDAGLVLRLVHIHALLADVEQAVFLALGAFHFQQRGVLVLVTQTPLVTCK